MSRILLLSAFVGVCVGLFVPGETIRPSEVIEGEYIVVFKKGLSESLSSDHFLKVQHMVNETNIKHRININNGDFQAYSAKNLSPEQASIIAKLPDVASVEQNGVDYIAQSCPTFTSFSWGLSRSVISGRISNPPQTTRDDYRMGADQTGDGVDLVIMDTGIQCTHNDFTGRCTWGLDTTGEGERDGNGHGTHVASTAGGDQFGLARRANLIAVKVCTNGGSCPVDSQLAGIAYTARRVEVNRRVVGNMSLGGNVQRPNVYAAVAAAVRAGASIVVAAGNSNTNACGGSPSGAPDAFTVGSTDAMDARSSFSSFGPCVKIFAPGSSINAAWIGSNTNTRVASGTSMASPHTAGMLAKLWSMNPSATNLQIQNTLVQTANSDLIRNPGTGSPNLLALVSC